MAEATDTETLICKPCMGKQAVIGHEIVPRQGTCAHCAVNGTVWSFWLPIVPSQAATQ